FFFFFSSRRRHTRCLSDWSSDVCSSDLVRFGYGGLHLTSVARALPEGFKFKSRYKWLSRFLKCKYFDPSSLAECMLGLIVGRQRSEERRVGKECILVRLRDRCSLELYLV